MTEDPPHRRCRWPLAALLLGFLFVPTFAAAQEKTPPPRSGTAANSDNPRAPGARMSGHLLYGDDAPGFQLQDAAGGTFHLRQYKDHASVVLMFVERPDLELERYAAAADSLRELGTWIVFVAHQRLPSGQSLAKSTVAYDRLGEVARMYGSLDPVTEDVIPSLFLVDTHGDVRYIAVGALPAAETLAATIRGILQSQEAQ